MPTMNVPTAVVAVLRVLKEATDLRDPQGHIIGTFVPSVPVEGSGWTQEELREAERVRREERDRGRPLQDFWREVTGKGNA